MTNKEINKLPNPIINKNMTFYRQDFRKILPSLKNFQTVIVDPPYNINFDYGGKYKDNIRPDDYKKLMYDVLNLSYKSTKKDSSLFLINYPQIIAELFETIKTTDWKIHQWISWVYPSNIGHSDNKFTTSHRSILWLTKDNPKLLFNKETNPKGISKEEFISYKPKVNIDSVTQPYKNPTDRRVRKLIESGKKGTHLYNWWEINLVKNVSKDKELYANQIPNEVLKRLILVTTDKRNKVLDPMCGTGSTVVAAHREGRVGVGVDLNSELRKIWRKL
tara:strand:+ start:165 stop:992 length:828 start_codon:yes stop_codon:yes gene_type:complete